MRRGVPEAEGQPSDADAHLRSEPRPAAGRVRGPISGRHPASPVASPVTGPETAPDPKEVASCGITRAPSRHVFQAGYKQTAYWYCDRRSAKCRMGSDRTETHVKSVDRASGAPGNGEPHRSRRRSRTTEEKDAVAEGAVAQPIAMSSMLPP